MKQLARVKAKAKGNNRGKVCRIKWNSTEFSEFLNDLLPDLTNAPSEARDFFLQLLKKPSGLRVFESEITSRTGLTISIKPSQRFIDCAAALRAGNFDFFVIADGHSFSFVESGLVELPILSTLEELPTERNEGSIAL